MSRLVLPPGVQADGYDARSGLHLAAEAHAAGAVEPAGPPADTFDVSVTFTARGAAAEIRESVDRMTGGRWAVFTPYRRHSSRTSPGRTAVRPCSMRCTFETEATWAAATSSRVRCERSRQARSSRPSWRRTTIEPVSGI